jgi:hypothetical protein
MPPQNIFSNGRSLWQPFSNLVKLFIDLTQLHEGFHTSEVAAFAEFREEVEVLSADAKAGALRGLYSRIEVMKVDYVRNVRIRAINAILYYKKEHGENLLVHEVKTNVESAIVLATPPPPTEGVGSSALNRASASKLSVRMIIRDHDELKTSSRSFREGTDFARNFNPTEVGQILHFSNNTDDETAAAYTGLYQEEITTMARERQAFIVQLRSQILRVVVCEATQPLFAPTQPLFAPTQPLFTPILFVPRQVQPIVPTQLVFMPTQQVQPIVPLALPVAEALQAVEFEDEGDPEVNQLLLLLPHLIVEEKEEKKTA